MEGPISFWGYKEQESNLILPEHDDDDDDDDDDLTITPVLCELENHELTATPVSRNSVTSQPLAQLSL